MPPAVAAPPLTPAEPVTETLHGVEVTDPHRWLEDQNSPQTREWLEEQAAYTRGYFDVIPHREQIKERVRDLMTFKEVISEPWNVGDRYFFVKHQVNGEQPVIVVRDGLSGPERVLIDPDRGIGESTAVGIVAVSEDGRFLAHSVRQGGNDHSTVELLGSEGGSVVPDGLPAGSCTEFVLAPDCSAFYYSEREAYDARQTTRLHFGIALTLYGPLDKEVFVGAWMQLQAIGPVPSESNREFTEHGDSSCI